MQIFRLRWSAVLGKVAGRGDCKLADRASEPNGHYFLFQQFA